MLIDKKKYNLKKPKTQIIIRGKIMCSEIWILNVVKYWSLEIGRDY